MAAIDELFNTGQQPTQTSTQQLFTSPSGIQGTPTQSTQASQQSSLDLQSELATIRGMKQGGGSGGIGSTIGSIGGTAAGAYFGGPAGAAAGQAAGQAVGSVVDYLIDSDDREKAKRERERAINEEIARQKAIATSKANVASLARRRGIALSREEEAMNEQKVISDTRRNNMATIMNMISERAKNSDYLRNKFIADRRIG